MKGIVEVLMNRDGVTEKEAKAQVAVAKERINEAIEAGRFFEVDDIMYEELGLEMDYIFELI